MITANQKSEIANLLAVYVTHYPSQAKAFASIKNMSEATGIQILNSKWKDIADQMWINVGKQIGWNVKSFTLVETQDVRTQIGRAHV